MSENGDKSTGGVETSRVDANDGRAGDVETNDINWSGQETSFENILWPDVNKIARRRESLRDKVAVTASRVEHEESAVSILLVAKFREPGWVTTALRAGGSPIDYNYIQRLEEGGGALTELDISSHRVHVIGHVQANRAGKAIRAADCIETVDSPRLAVRLDRLQGERILASKSRKDGSPPGPFDVMTQVNFAGSESQHGVGPSGVVNLVGAVVDLPNLRLVGLMFIGANTDDVAAVVVSHTRVRELQDVAQAADVASCTELSTDMTGDTEIAIAEDSTEI